MNIQRLLAATLAIVLVMGISTPAFGETISSGSGSPTPGTGAVATTSQTSSSTCVVIDFEGVGDLVPIGTIGDVTFSANGVGLVDLDAGGTGNFANEPSPDTIMFVAAGGANVITATLANPVQEISWNYVSINPGEIRVFGAGNVLLATIALPPIPQVNPGDPTGGAFGTWDSGIHTEVGNVITSVEYDALADQIGWDDLDYCVKFVGGELLPINTTALILAGAQTNAVWIMSALAVIGSVAFGALYLKTRRN